MRPLGVTILAILNYLLGAIVLAVGIALRSGTMGEPPLGTPMPFGSMQTAANLFIFLGALSVLLGWGLWTLHNWARILMIVSCVLGLIMAALGLVSEATRPEAVFELAVNTIVMLYLIKPQVKQVFA
jgi:hypothetical protein